MTRVLIVEAAGNLWGSERALIDLLDGMPRSDVAVCCPPGTPLQAELEKRGVRTIPTYIYGLHEKPRWRRAQAALGVLRACLRFRPDVIHLNQSGSYKVVLPAALLLRLPIVAHVRIFEDAEYLASQAHMALLRGVIAISDAVEADIRRLPRLSAVPLSRIYDAYTPVGDAQVVKVAGRIACVGRLVPIKGQDVLVEALTLLGDTKVDCKMVGDGDPAFTARLRQSPGAGAVEWLGFVREVMPLLRTCEVLACPSWREPLGRVILEAWDAGSVPVVFAGSGGAAEVVRAADGGVLYEEQTPGCLADALRTTLALSPGEKERLVANGRAWMDKTCAPAAYGQAVMAVFARAAAR